MRALILLTQGGFTLIFLVGFAAAAEIPREPMDRLWEHHMLIGKGGSFKDGQPDTPSIPLRSFEEEKRGKAAGSPFLMDFTEHSINVDDFRGTRFLGLLRGGGWTLRGGLLERFAIDSGTLELWGKIINRVYPGLWDNYYRFKEDQTYEFFLVHRRSDRGEGKILKKWTIRPEQVRWFVPERAHKGSFEVSDVRGYLDYDTVTKIATVKINGLTTPISEGLNLSGSLTE